MTTTLRRKALLQENKTPLWILCESKDREGHMVRRRPKNKFKEGNTKNAENVDCLYLMSDDQLNIG